MTAPSSVLPRSFYECPADRLAPRLVGCVLVRDLGGGVRLAGRIIEVEAYLGVRDRASHAFGGRRTARNGSMYGKPGLAYVYFTYGMHYCFNVVCGEEGTPAAVLVRALEPMEGLEEMFRRRGRTARTPRELCSGPGRLTKAMGIDRDLDGVDLCVGTGVFIQAPLGRRPSLIPGPRVGIGDCGSWTARALRWHPRGSPWASRPRLG